MKYTKWTRAPLDERIRVFMDAGKGVLTCRVSSGHHSTLDDELLDVCNSWYHEPTSANKNLTNLTQKLREITLSMKQNSGHIFFSCFRAFGHGEKLSVQSIGGFFCSFINGRRMTGGLEKTPFWRGRFSDAHRLDETPPSSQNYVEYDLDLDGHDQVMIGTSLLDCYASLADIAQFSNDFEHENTSDRLARFGNELASRAESHFNQRSRHRLPLFEDEQLLVCVCRGT